MPSPLAGEGGSRSEPGEGFFLAFPTKIGPNLPVMPVPVMQLQCRMLCCDGSNAALAFCAKFPTNWLFP
jgi:hypothetical protein